METTRETESLASTSARPRRFTGDHALELPIHGPADTDSRTSDAYRQALINLDDFERRIVGVSKAVWEADFARTHVSLVSAACQAYASVVREGLE